MLHLCPIQSGFDIISTPGGVVNGFLSILQRKPLAFSFLWGSQTFDHFSGADQRPRRGRSRPKAPPESGVDRLTVPVSGLPAWWGRFPLGVPFDWPKGTKSHLGRSPLRTSLRVRGCPCVKAMFGPSPLLWRLVMPPHQATLGSRPYNQAVSTSGPTLEERRSRRRKPGPR